MLFLPCDFMHKCTVLSMPLHGLSVCLSVYLSVAFVYSVEMNKHIFNIFHHWAATPF